MPSDILPPPPEGRPLTAPHSHVVMTFGAEGFFGYGPCDGPQHHTSLQGSEAPGGSLPYGNRAMWWSRYPRDSSETRNVDVEDMQKQLLKRHANWKDPVIRRILTETKMDTAVATWITPKLPTWAADRVFLVGDAAHGKPCLLSINQRLR
jgi:2-polyprenyl-6-methoxyphenol hydroxylase-like FAD-dependent oxidoreductase